MSEVECEIRALKNLPSSHRLFPFRSPDGLGVRCRTSPLSGAGASPEAASAVETHTHTHGEISGLSVKALVKNSFAVKAKPCWFTLQSAPPLVPTLSTTLALSVGQQAVSQRGKNPS